MSNIAIRWVATYVCLLSSFQTALENVVSEASDPSECPDDVEAEEWGQVVATLQNAKKNVLNSIKKRLGHSPERHAMHGALLRP